MARMKTTSFVLSAVLVAALGCKKNDSGASGDPSSAAAGPGAPLGGLSDFEGEIGIAAKSTKDKVPSAPITVFIKAGKLRFDMPKPEGRPPTKGYIVINAQEKKSIIVDDDKRTAMVFDVSKLQQQLGQFGVPTTPQTAAATQTPPKITKTGHTDTVAGYLCEDWDIQSNDGKRARVCVSEGAASWLDVVSHAVPGNLMWAREFLNGQKFPLRVIAFETDGTERDRIEVTKLEKKPLAETLFVVPTGYRTIDLEQMMNGLMGGMPPGMMGGQMPPRPAQPGTMPQMPTGMPQMPAGAIPPGGMSPAQRAQMEEAMKQMREQLEKQRAAQPQP